MVPFFCARNGYNGGIYTNFYGRIFPSVKAENKFLMRQLGTFSRGGDDLSYKKVH